MDDLGEADTNNSVQILIFTVNGTQFGINTNLVYQIIDPETLEDEVQVHKLDEVLKFGEDRINYRTPKTILIRKSDELRGLMIESPEDIVDCKINEFKSLPYLATIYNPANVIRHVVPLQGRLILILDPYAFLKAIEIK